MRRSSKFNFYLETICGYILVLIMLASGVRLDGVYSIYNPQQNYTSYLDILHVGDSITIHYNDKPGPYGTALYQITKGKETILS